MIITVLIIPLSLPVIFSILFYSATHNSWFMTVCHLTPVTDWHGVTGYVCLLLLLTVAAINLIAVLMTALLVTFLNRKQLPKLKCPLNR